MDIPPGASTVVSHVSHAHAHIMKRGSFTTLHFTSLRSSLSALSSKFSALSSKFPTQLEPVIFPSGLKKIPHVREKNRLTRATRQTRQPSDRLGVPRKQITDGMRKKLPPSTSEPSARWRFGDRQTGRHGIRDNPCAGTETAVPLQREPERSMCRHTGWAAAIPTLTYTHTRLWLSK